MLAPSDDWATYKLPDRASKDTQNVDFDIMYQKLHQKLKLLAVHLSGKQSNIETFHAKLQTLSRNCEECWIQNMTQFSVNNKSIWHQGLKIPNVHM